jgi:hypothetical protein
MGWSLGYDSNWQRDVGYGVPAFCDHPGCFKEIDRGLSHVCGGEPYGGDKGCGLYFCGEHMTGFDSSQRCARCRPRRPKPFKPTPDHPLWIRHKLLDPSWAKWREEQGEEKIEALRDKIGYTMTLDLRAEEEVDV